MTDFGEQRPSRTERAVLALLAEQEVVAVAALSIRNLDNDVKERLRVRAARHGRSMESEVRAILVEAAGDPDESEGFLLAIRDRFNQIGGVDLDLPTRGAGVDPEIRERITEAAAASHESVSGFVMLAARAEAERVLGRTDVTLMPAEQFDAMVASLDVGDQVPNLSRAAARERRFERA